MPLIKNLFKIFESVSFPALLSRDFFLVKLPLCFVYYSYRVAVCQNKRTLCTVLKALLGQPSEPKASWLPEFPFDVKKKHSNVKSQISSMIKDNSLQFHKFFANFLIIKIYTIMKQPWKIQQLQKISSSFFNVSRSVLFFLLLSCWEGVITNCSEIQQSLALGFIRFFVKYDFGLGLNFAEFLLYILVRSIEI